MVLRFSLDRRGSITLLSAFGMTAMLGMVGLAIDLGLAYAQELRLQKVADSAALAGAISWVKSGGSTAATTATIKALVAANGWPASTVQTGGTGLLKASPKNAANPAIQVTLAAPSALLLASVLSKLTSVTTTSYAAAEIAGSGGGTACVLALNSLIINSVIAALGCSLQANGTASNAITLNGGAVVTAVSIDTPGGVMNNGVIAGNIVANGGVTNQGVIVGTIATTGAGVVQDPFANTQTAAAAGFTGCQAYKNQSQLTTPGCYSNVVVNTLSTLTLSPGTYYFSGLNLNTAGVLIGTGVTIITQGNFSPNGVLAITAPTSGTFAGIAVYAMGGMNFNSGVTFTINGAIYAPSSTIFPNTGIWLGGCTYLVAQNVTYNGGVTFTLPQNNCSAYNYPAPQLPSAGKVALVQ